VRVRYEIGRHSSSRWSSWNENLKKIASNPRNIVAANNLYDAEYIKYAHPFLSIQNRLASPPLLSVQTGWHPAAFFPEIEQ
jgi:hypothetical protein